MDRPHLGYAELGKERSAATFEIGTVSIFLALSLSRII